MDCSTPGFPVHHQLLEPTQTHVHRISGAIQTSHPLLSHSSPIFKSFPASGSFPVSQLFASGSQSIGVSASAEFSRNSGLISFSTDWLDLLVVQGTVKSLLQHQFKSINSSVLSLLHSPTLTSRHDYWKNHRFD